MRALSALFCLLAVGAHAALLPEWMTNTEEVQARNLDFIDGPLNQGPSSTMLQARADDPPYWMKDIKKQGIAAFNQQPSTYKVWRNVKDYGAKGDGVTDDTAAINNAIKDGNRCAPYFCQSTTTSPAIVYFPAGTYLVKSRIEVYYLTTLLGNANSRPIIKAAADYGSVDHNKFIIDSAPYNDRQDLPGIAPGSPAWVSTNIFMRQIRNLVVDMTSLPVNQAYNGIHWPTSQATTIQNVKVVMAKDSSSSQTGIFVENGSAGFMVDIETQGGKYGMEIGNQQFTMRNLYIHDAVTGIRQIWDWGWLYQGVHIENCQTAFSMVGKNDTTLDLLVGSVILMDSSATNCGTFVEMDWDQNSSKPKGAGQLILENIELRNVPVAVKRPSGTVLQGGTTTIAGWGQGIKYSPDGPQRFQGAFTPAKRPASLLDPNGNGKIYSKQKPQYEALPVSNFISARDSGAKGDGNTDDTAALQKAINNAVSSNKILFVDHGTYKVTNTIYLPPGTKMVGEFFSVIMASGSVWSDKSKPVPVVQIGKSGEKGRIEWSDMIVATQGPTPGAKIIEYNLASDIGSGLWDVHTRIGGAAGTRLQTPQCPVGSQKSDCYAAYINVHVTKSATGAYFENNWFWTADHDLDDAINNSTRVSIFTGRGMLVEASTVWMYGGGSEHHALYQYQFANAKDIFAGYIQTETPYWQPNPDAKNQPYPLNSALNDPDYNTICSSSGACDALGLRILNCESVRIYAMGLYSFFKNYDVSCSSPDAPNGARECQNRIFSIEGSTKDLQIYSLNEVGATQMVTIDGVDKAKWSDNLSVYSNTIGLFTYKI